MANFDEEIKKITDEILEDGTVDKIIRENIINGFKLAIERSFSYGKLSDAIRKKTDEVLVPFIEKYDMNNYIVKLDTVLSEIVNSTAFVENKKILKNFKNLMIEPEKETITVSELFEQYKRYVAKEMDTDGRDVQIEDTVYYKPMEVSFEFKKGQDRSWSYFDRAVLEFGVTEEEQQENLNRTIRLDHYKKGAEGWNIITEINPEITSLRYLDDFDILLIRLSKGMVKLIINEESDWDNVISDNKPQETYK